MFIAKQLHQLLVKAVALIYSIVAPTTSDATLSHSAPRILMLADESIGGLMSFGLDIGYPDSVATSPVGDARGGSSAP